MTHLVIAQADLALLQERLLNKKTEVCAILFTKSAKGFEGNLRVLVREVSFPETEDYVEQSPIVAVLSPEYVARVTKKSHLENAGLVFVHSHLGTTEPEFSRTDDAGELLLREFLERRHPQQPHLTLVVSLGGVCARVLGSTESVRVTAIGAFLSDLTNRSGKATTSFERYDRQVRAFGIDGQSRLGDLRVGIVGLGGTGSLIAEQLAHLGVRKFLLIDPDVIEETNLNRVVGAYPGDVGSPKVVVAERHILTISPGAEVIPIQGNVVIQSVAQRLTEVDFMFGCTDSHGSRSILQQIAYQYFIPAIDMGTIIVTSKGKITHIAGRSQLLSPGHACLRCCGLIDPAQVRADLLSEFERQQDPYLAGAHEPAPAVIGINGTVASLSTTMFLSVVLGIPGESRNQVYDGIKGTVRSVVFSQDGDCYVCSSSGMLGRAATTKLLAREG